MRNLTLIAAFLAIAVLSGSSQYVQPIGGMKPIYMFTSNKQDNSKPRFADITILPGRGMSIFQITANIPGQGWIRVFKAPEIEAANSIFTGAGNDLNGRANTSCCGAFLIPFSSRMSGKLSDDTKTVTTTWHGKSITMPNNFMGKYAVHGFMGELKATDIHVVESPGGQTATATIHAGNFNGHWLSSTDLHYKVVLTSDAVDISITAVNVGHEPEPFAIGWHPYLNIPSKDRSQARVHIPGVTYSEIATDDNHPTGKLLPVKETPYDFTNPKGALLPADSLNINLNHLQRTNNTVDAWLEDPKSHYGIRVRGLSPQINTVHLYSPKTDTFAAIEEQFNYMDALGPQWNGMDTGMVTLKPGDSTTWHVRLELFTPAN